eukprot:SAG31_NODE_234_length_19701_cov_16.835068_7_plen_106_part_00
MPYTLSTAVLGLSRSPQASLVALQGVALVRSLDHNRNNKKYSLTGARRQAIVQCIEQLQCLRARRGTEICNHAVWSGVQQQRWQAADQFLQHLLKSGAAVTSMQS